MLILACLGCAALALSLTGCKKTNTALMVAGQCLGGVVLVLTLSILLNN